MSIPELMKAAVLYGRGDMRLVDNYPVPQPGPGEVLIQVKACAICGTDPKILAHGWPNHPPYGTFIFGHEYTGTIAALGENVTEFTTGDRVAVEPHKGCGFCANCRDGLYNTCLNYGIHEKGHRHYGFTANGGYAEYACNHVNSVYKIPDKLSFDESTLITTAATSLYGIRRIGGIKAGETVVVSGPGAIGLMAVVMARTLGAGTIILTGTRPERLNVGRSLGADVAINVREENVVERVMALTGGIGADAAIECAGTRQAAVDAVEFSKKNGRVALVGIYQEAAPLNVNKIVQWNITLAGSKAEGERSLAQALALFGRRSIDLSPLITHTFPLDQIHAAFETAEKRLGGAIKVVIKP
ncbi:MAG: alcohol dehydrogenase catalytic domain-containing protein [Anaerolineales bacterium]|nr:alcohol dehydrogenase catalytic domain-containing protein [Anaerolineales bacterium]